MKTLETQQDYEQRELLAFHNQIERIERAPLSERKEGAKYFADALTIEWRLAERTEWILNGSYGYGCYLSAKRVIDSPRMNHAAWFGQVIAALDHGCPASLARKAFLALPKDRQDKINAEITKAIHDFIN